MGGLPSCSQEAEVVEEEVMFEEEEQQPDAGLQGAAVAAVAAAGPAAQPRAGTSRAPTRRPAPITQVCRIDDALVEVMEKLRDTGDGRDARLAAATNPRIIWGQWVGTEMKGLGQVDWMNFTSDVHKVMAKYQQDATLQQQQQPPNSRTTG